MHEASPAKSAASGSLILALGIISLIVCWPLGIVVWVMGARTERVADPAERALAKGGKVCGMIATAATLLFVVFLAMMPAIRDQIWELNDRIQRLSIGNPENETYMPDSKKPERVRQLKPGSNAANSKTSKEDSR
jgi:hypothetical protein